MAFHVTQCPSCDSSFNTSARLLEAAAGKVRCGACLTVFVATENFISQGDAAIADQAEDSVFIGNNPLDFFDPSLFLTRRALTETDEIDSTELSNYGSDEESLNADVPAQPPESIQASIEPSLPLTESPESSENNEVSELTDSFEPSESSESSESAEPSESVDPSEPSEPSEPPEPSESLEPVEPRESSEAPAYSVPPETTEATESPEASALEQSDSLVPVVFTVANSVDEEASATLDEQEQPPEEELQLDKNQTMSKQSQQHPGTQSMEPLAPEDIRLELSFSIQHGRPVAIDAELEFSAAVEAGAEAESDIEETELFTLEPEIETDPISDQSSASAIEETIVETSEEFADETTQETSEELAEEATEETSVESGLEDDSVEPEDNTATIRALALGVELKDDDALEAISEENIAVLGKMSTPLELLAGKENSWARGLMLSLSIFTLAGLLVTQFLWQRMPVYNQVPQLRAYYEIGCAWIGCELPQYTNIDAIRSDLLTVRSDPQRDDGLQVNISFRNTAQFPQPFPIMLLSFNTLTNEIVALREFAPEEYLDPGLRSITMMPVMAPVQVTLNLIDPGPDAVNYTLAFRLH